SGNWETSVGGITRLKHRGQSGHPIPEPVLLTTPPAAITRNKTIIVSLFAFTNRFSGDGYIIFPLNIVHKTDRGRDRLPFICSVVFFIPFSLDSHSFLVTLKIVQHIGAHRF